MNIESNRKKIESIQNSLVGKGSELNQVYNLCAVMEICGGYEQLQNLPIPALNLIMKYLEFVNKQASKGMPRVPRGRR